MGNKQTSKQAKEQKSTIQAGETKQARDNKKVKSQATKEIKKAEMVENLKAEMVQAEETKKPSYKDASEILIDKITGDIQERITEENLTTKYLKVKGISRNEFYIKNYTDDINDDKNHNFSKIFGLNYSSWKVLQIKLEKENKLNGKIITISADSGNNHIIFIIPNKPLELLAIDEKTKIILTPENYLEHPIIINRHGRLYNMARILSYTYKLQYNDLPNGSYCLSNYNNLNFRLENDEFKLYNLQGDLRKACNPLQYITGKANAKDILK